MIRLKTLDLAVSMLDDDGDVAHQTVQKRRIGRQIVEIKLHVRFYSDVLIRRSKFAIFYAGFCDSQPAIAGRHTRSGVRQSMPSISIASCAGDSVTVPPGSLIRGQTKPP